MIQIYKSKNTPSYLDNPKAWNSDPKPTLHEPHSSCLFCATPFLFSPMEDSLFQNPVPTLLISCFHFIVSTAKWASLSWDWPSLTQKCRAKTPQTGENSAIGIKMIHSMNSVQFHPIQGAWGCHLEMLWNWTLSICLWTARPQTWQTLILTYRLLSFIDISNPTFGGSVSLCFKTKLHLRCIQQTLLSSNAENVHCKKRDICFLVTSL